MVTEPCIICSSTGCTCKSSLYRFHELLAAKASEVLREELTSGNAETPKLMSAGVDKLNGYFLSKVNLKKICDSAIRADLFSRFIFLNDGHQYLEIQKDSKKLHFKIFQGTELMLSNLVSNPNHFDSWEDYLSFLRLIVPGEAIENFRISRVDLNLDFQTKFEDLIQSLDIVGKQCAVSFQDQSGNRTGITFGKGSSTITVYNKSLKNKLSEPLSRVELRLTKTALPTKNILHLREVLLNDLFFEELIGIEVMPKSYVPPSADQQKLLKFSSIMKREGFLSARKACNEDRNFIRNFKSLIEIRRWCYQPTELFQENIKSFFTVQNTKEQRYE